MAFALTSIALSHLYPSAPAAAPGFAYVSNVGDFSTHVATAAATNADGADIISMADTIALAFAVTITADLGHVEVPRGYRRALSSPQAQYWREAIAKELAGLIALHTWDLVLQSTMPDGSNLMNCHYVFAVKRKKDGTIEKFKARLVADGNTQKHGVDFDRIFATVIKITTVRLALLLAAALDYNLSSIDIRQAYLQAQLNENLYMRVPPGIWPFDKQRRPLVCKLRRSLYGLKQAGREWAVLFTSFLVGWGLVRSTIDPCLYILPGAATILWVLVHVDDALIVDNEPDLRARFVKDLSARFPTEDKGELEWMLNVAISRDRAAKSLTLSQSLYVSDLATKFGGYITTSRRFDCPMEEGTLLSPSDCPAVGSDAHAAMAPQRSVYMSLVGGYLWLANMTMPYIAYAASQLARFMTNPGPTHFSAAVRVLAYLRDAGDRPLVFKINLSRGLDTYVDSDWAVKFSCSGAMYFYHGCLFHWFSKMQHSVSLSSAEAEYFGAMMASRDLIFVRDLLFEFGIRFTSPPVLSSDSGSAVKMSMDPVAFKQTKHILRAAEFLRDLVAREVIRVADVSGKVMLADLLTKAVSRAVFLALLRLLDTFSVDGVVVPS